MYSHLREMDVYLGTRRDDVRFIGIQGMGGIGKTTIARVLYDRIQYEYEVCCFLMNVREVLSKSKSLIDLQKQLLSRILGGKFSDVCDDHQVATLIRKVLSNRKALLVLDDVDKLEQLKGLAGEHNWFGRGSRIIITTRDENLLINHGVNRVYKVKELDNDDALQLLRQKAFALTSPTDEHLELLQRVKSYANGLPLALEILGRHLCDSDITIWRSLLDRLKQIPDDGILERLRISYDELPQLEKELFLDIACFFKGKDKDRVTDILNNRGFFTDIGMKVLIEESLVKIYCNKLWMHDLIQEMGWKIIKEQDLKEPGKWSRLWLFKDFHHVVTRYTATNKVEGIMLHVPEDQTLSLNGEIFSTIYNLRLLKICNIHNIKGLKDLSKGLRVLKWQGYLKSLPPNIKPEEFVELNMCYSNIKYLWTGMKCLQNLKTIKLRRCLYLTTTPDFIYIPNLVSLNLEGCKRLLVIYPSIGGLEKLIELNLKNCTNLVSLPSKMAGMTSLKFLNLCRCSKLNNLPEDLGEVESLEVLDVSETAIGEIPPSVGNLMKLKMLSLQGCNGKPPQITCTLFPCLLLLSEIGLDSKCLSLPPLSGLRSLTNLDLSDCDLKVIPDSLGALSTLQVLNLSKNNFVSLPASINQLSKLEKLYLCECKILESLPELPSGELDHVGADDCACLEAISRPQKQLSSKFGTALRFFNCLKLVRSEGTRRSMLALLPKLAFLGLSTPLNRSAIYFPCFQIIIPGGEVPEFISSSREENSLTIRLPYGAYRMGFVVCAVLSQNLSDHLQEFFGMIECHIKIDSNFRSLSIPIFFDRVFNSKHIWLAFFRPTYHVMFARVNNYIQVNFKTLNSDILKVEKCGIHFFRDNEIVEWDTLSRKKVADGDVHFT